MTSPTATITGRVVGPDGLGRLGRITLTPLKPAPGLGQSVLSGRVSARLNTDGYLVGPAGPSLIVAAGDYEIDLNIPGDLGIHLRRKVRLSESQDLTLADLLARSAPPPPAPPQPPEPPTGGLLTPDGHEVRQAGGSDVLEAAESAEIIDLGNGVLAWRKLDDGLVRPDGRSVRYAGTAGILEAMDKASVIDLGNGALTWR